MNDRQTVQVKVYYRGSYWTVVLGDDGSGKHPAQEFINDLEARWQEAIDAAIERLANAPNGQLRNREKFKKVEGTDPALWEFKEFQARLLCSMESNRTLVLLYGEVKKRDALSPGTIRRAYRVLLTHRALVARLQQRQGGQKGIRTR